MHGTGDIAQRILLKSTSMEQADFKRFAQAMAALAEIYSVELSGPGLQLRFASLKEYTINQIEAATMAVLKTRKYTKMPTPGELIEHISGALEDRGELEAEHVLYTIRSKGCDSGYAFEDPITQAVVNQRFGGLNGLRTMEDKEVSWFVTQFRQAYAVRARLNGRIANPKISGTESDRISNITKGLYKLP